MGLMTPSSCAMPVGVNGEGKVACSKLLQNSCALRDILLYVSVGNVGSRVLIWCLFRSRRFPNGSGRGDRGFVLEVHSTSAYDNDATWA